MFPTEAARRIAKNADLLHTDKRCVIEEPALGALQKISVLHDFNEAFRVYEAMMGELLEEFTEDQIETLKLISEITRVEVNGYIVGGVAKVFHDSKAADNIKLQAAQVLNSLAKGENVVSEKTTEKLVINLAKE